MDEPEILVRVAEQAVNIMNQEVALSEYHDKCAPIGVDREKTVKMQMQEFDQQDGKRIFRASFRVLPSGGLYDAFAEVDSRIFNSTINCFSTETAKSN